MSPENRRLQPGAVDDLVVDGHLQTIVVDDEDADGAAAVVEGLGKARGETALVEDGKTLLDIARLGHGNDAAVFTDVEDTVLLEDRAEHVLDNDRGSGVGDEAGLLVQLLGEEVNTEVAVLASLPWRIRRSPMRMWWQGMVMVLAEAILRAVAGAAGT